MGSKNNTPLALVDIKDIMEELVSRYENAVFAGGGAYDTDNDVEFAYYAGHPSLCLGLAARLTHKINVDQSDNLQSLDD